MAIVVVVVVVVVAVDVVVAVVVLIMRLLPLWANSTQAQNGTWSGALSH